MKTGFYLILLLALVSATDNSKFQKIVDNFTKAISTGDSEFLDQNLYPTAIWSAPNQKILRGRKEIIDNHKVGIEQGHQIKTKNIEFSSEDDMLQAFGYFDYLQESGEILKSGRFSAVFQSDRAGVYLLTHGLWHLDGSHIKDDKKQKCDDNNTCNQ